MRAWAPEMYGIYQVDIVLPAAAPSVPSGIGGLACRVRDSVTPVAAYMPVRTP
jgi:hypothetical protein